MGAKHNISKLAYPGLAYLCMLPGCAAVERLAPPGIIRYEDLARGQPVIPAIQERIDERRAAGAGEFPILSAQPDEPPAAMPPAEREEMTGALLAERDQVAVKIKTDRELAAAERELGALIPGEKSKGRRSPEEARDALSEAIAKDSEEAARERAGPLVPDRQ